MKIVEKSGNEIVLLALPSEEVLRGEYVLIEDEFQGRQILVQVYDESYLDTPELINDIVRDEVLHSSSKGIDNDPHEISGINYLIRDMKLLKCKIRGAIDRVDLTPNVAWLPSRVNSKIRKLSIEELSSFSKRFGYRTIPIGVSQDGGTFNIYAESLDGKLNIITGKKGTGKSHLAKLIIAKLIEYGAYVIVFDLNNEYGGIGWKHDSKPSPILDRVVQLVPGESLKFTLDYIGLSGMLNMLLHSLDIPGASLREFVRIWEMLQAQGMIDMLALGEAIKKSRCNELVRDALLSRYYTILSSKLVSERKENLLFFESLFSRLNRGGALVISLNRLQPQIRKLSVEIVLSKIVELLERKLIPPIFLFAEEAHIYLRETYWDDIITRMRHFGIFTTFITNQPDAIKDSIYRQADNLFLFNFTNELDLETISRASVTDSATIKTIARTLPPRNCMLLGKIVDELPIIVTVKPTEMLTLGETNFFFKERSQEIQIKMQSG